MSMATVLNLGVCRSCRAPVLWAKSTRRRKRNGEPVGVPLERDPVEAHTAGALVLVNGWAYGPKDLAERLAQRREISVETAELAIVLEGWPWHVNHFVNCPHADKHRRRKGRRR